MIGGLRARLVGSVLGVLLALLALCATLVVMRAEKALLEAQQARAEAATRQLADTVGYGVLARSEALLQPSLESFARSPDLVSVEVRDETGALLARRDGSSGGSALPLRVQVPVRTRANAPGDDDGELKAFGAGTGTPQVVGSVSALFSLEATERVQRRVRWDIITAFVGVGGLGLLGILLLASSVVRRVSRLAKAAAQVAGGELAVRVDESGGDELAALGRDFNAMTASLGRQRVALEDAGHQLAEREALAAIGRATAVIAHELKNPLGILLGAAGIVANPARPEEARRQAGQIIDEEVRRLERTLRGLLEYARPRPPEKVAVDALALCRTAAERSTLPGAPAEGCAVGVSGSLAQALADASQVEQVLLNLIANAAQAGARKIAITVGCASSRVSVEVADDGPGIAAEIRDQLFRPFVTTKQRGAGLGLAGSRRMARDNGGDLRHLPSESGARFVLELAQANAPGATTGPTTQGATPR